MSGAGTGHGAWHREDPNQEDRDEGPERDDAEGDRELAAFGGAQRAWTTWEAQRRGEAAGGARPAAGKATVEQLAKRLAVLPETIEGWRAEALSVIEGAFRQKPQTSERERQLERDKESLERVVTKLVMKTEPLERATGRFVVVDRYFSITMACARARGEGAMLDGIAARVMPVDVTFFTDFDESTRCERLARLGTNVEDRWTVEATNAEKLRRAYATTLEGRWSGRVVRSDASCAVDALVGAAVEAVVRNGGVYLGAGAFASPRQGMQPAVDGAHGPAGAANLHFARGV